MAAGDTNSPVTDFTSLDFTSMDEDLQRYARTRFPTDVWTNFSASNPGSLLIELLAYAGDLLAYQINASALEVNPTTVRKESNFRSMCKTLGYRMKGISTSTTVLRFYNLPDPTSPDFPPGMAHTFYARPQLQATASSNQLVFQPTSTVLVDLDNLQVDPVRGRYFDIDANQGEELTDTFNGTGAISQVIDLSGTSILEDTVSVVVNSEVWSEVANLVLVTATEKVYSIEFSETGTARITFGDGKGGKAPAVGSDNIVVTYRVGGGAVSDVPEGAIDTISGSSDPAVYPLPDQLLNASVVNIVDAEGGGPRQTLDNAKANLAGVRMINDRCVVNDDYAIEAVHSVPGVYAAMGLAGKPQGGGTPVMLLVVPSDINGAPVMGNPSKALGNVISNALESKKMSEKRILVRGAYFVYLEVDIDAFVLAKAASAKAKAAVESSVLAQYAPDSLGFNPSFSLQDLYALLSPSNVEGISHVLVKGFSLKPSTGRHVNTTTMGNGEIVWNSVNKTIAQRREWLVRIGPSLGQYTVLERIPGQINRVTDLVVEDDAARFTPNGLVGWSFHPAPDAQDLTRSVVSNTETSFVTTGGNRDFASPSDDYVVERVAGMGKVVVCRVSTEAVAGSTHLHVTGAAALLPGDKILVRTTGGYTDTFTVVTKVTDPWPLPTFTLNLDKATTHVVPAASTVDYIWQSSDTSVQLAVAEGTYAFGKNDELYLDVFPQVGDIRTRKEHFVILSGANVVVSPVGGVR